MSEISQTIIGYLTAGGIVVWLGKIIINKFFDAALETFKNRLAILKIEHEIKYSKLHEERASILKKMFQELYTLEQELAYFTSMSQGPEWIDDTSRYQRTNSQLKECINLLEINRIYFSPKFCDNLEKCFKSSHEVMGEMEEARDNARIRKDLANYGTGIEFEEGKKPNQIWRTQRKKVENDIRTQRLELAEIFRELIGVEKVQP